VHLEAGDELAARDGAVLGLEPVVPSRPRQLTRRTREGVGSRGRRACHAARRLRQAAASRGERFDRRLSGWSRLGPDLELRGGQLGLEARIAAEPIKERPRAGREIQGLGVEEHRLLLEADREGVHRVEGVAKELGVEWRGVRCLAQVHRGDDRCMRLVVFPGVLRPPEDCRMLASIVAELGLARGASVLDVFAGSGALALAGAAAGAREVAAVDISRVAVLNVRLNAMLNRVRVDVRRGDMFAPFEGRRFDLIVANPPYVPSESDELPSFGPSRAWDAGPDGRAFLDRLCAQAPDHLTAGGSVMVVQSSLCGEEATLEALAAGGLESEVLGRRRGPLGPVAATRTKTLERNGLLRPGEREEDLLVIGGRRAEAAQLPAGTPAAKAIA
jgi:release factor glutamine methyltransferase